MGNFFRTFKCIFVCMIFSKIKSPKISVPILSTVIPCLTWWVFFLKHHVQTLNLLNNLKRYIGLSSKTYKQRSKCFLIQTDLLELKLLDPLFLSIYSILELALLLPITKKLEKLADESLEAVDEISVVVFYTTSSWQWYKRKRMKKCLFVLKVFKLRTLLDTESITKWDVLLLLILGR